MVFPPFSCLILVHTCVGGVFDVIVETYSLHELRLLSFSTLLAEALRFLNSTISTKLRVRRYLFKALLHSFTADLQDSFHHGTIFLVGLIIIFPMFLSADNIIASLSWFTAVLMSFEKFVFINRMLISSLNSSQLALDILHFMRLSEGWDLLSVIIIGKWSLS